MHQTILSDTLTVSRVITGLWQIADMERHGRLELTPLADAMTAYVKAGLTTFDMADHYGSAEDIAGLYGQRYGSNNVQMLTKWVPTPGAIKKNEVRTAIETSLKRLQTDHLDLLQFHTWSYADPSWLDALFYLQELKEEGLICNLGLTNFDAAHLRIALHSGIEIVSNQVSFSLLDQRAKNAMSDLCLEHNVKLLAYGTVAGGLLSERYLNKPEPNETTWSQMKYSRFIREAGGWKVFQSLLQTLHGLAQKHNVSIANVACNYVLEQPAVGAIIIGARLGSSEHIQDTLRLFEFSLDDESLAEIEKALTQLKPIPGDCGDEYRKPPFLTASGDLSHHIQSFPKPFKTVEKNDGRQLALSGTIWEDVAGFSRAVKHHDRILISGTTATHGNRVIGGNDAAAQTHFVIDKLEASLISLGGRLEDVVRTRVYVKNISDWEVVARAHGQRFKDILPANTLVQANLVGDEYLVEIEAEAIIA